MVLSEVCGNLRGIIWRTPRPPFQNRTANAGRGRLYVGRGGQCLKQIALRAADADLAVRHLDPLGERVEMVAG